MAKPRPPTKKHFTVTSIAAAAALILTLVQIAQAVMALLRGQ